MRVVVVIYPVPAQSVFCVVCFFSLFFFFGEFNILDTPLSKFQVVFLGGEWGRHCVFPAI